MKLIKVSEGKRRLRLFISILVAIFVYLFCLTIRNLYWDYVFIIYPIYSAISYLVMFLAITAVYWVLEGFHNNDTAKSKIKIYEANNLFDISKLFGIVCHKALMDFSGIKNKDGQEYKKANEMIEESWHEVALLYAFGLTSLCMLSVDQGFLNSNVAKDFAEKVANKIAELNLKESQKYFSEYTDPIRIKKRSEDKVDKMNLLVFEAYKSSSKYDNLGDLVKPINEHIENITGVTDGLFKDLSPILLTQINKKLAL